MSIKVKKTKKFGRGVYATKNIKSGEVIESSPVVILDSWESDRITSTVINRYVFAWKNISALALGFGSIFNHSEDNNVSYRCNYKKNTIDFKTIRDIKKDDQLFIDYGYEVEVAFEDTKYNREEALKDGTKSRN